MSLARDRRVVGTDFGFDFFQTSVGFCWLFVVAFDFGLDLSG